MGNICSPAVMQTGLFGRFNYFLNVTSGYVSDITWDTKIKPVNQPDYINLDSVKEFEIHSNWASFALIFFRRLEFYTYLGVSKESMDWRSKPGSPKGSDLKTNNHFSGLAGVKLTLLRFSSFAIGVDAQFFTIPSSNKIIQKIRDIKLPFLVGRQYLKIKEWNVGGGISAFLGPLTPYAGIKHMKMRVRVKSSTDLPTLKFDNRNTWGAFVGCSLSFSHNFYVNAEGRFNDESAVGVSATASF